MSAAVRAELEPHLEAVPLRQGDVLYAAGGPLDWVYFPNSGLIAVIITMESGQTAYTSLVGKSGMLSSAVVLDLSMALDHALVEFPGTVVRIAKTVSLLHTVATMQPLTRPMDCAFGFSTAGQRQRAGGDREPLVTRKATLASVVAKASPRTPANSALKASSHRLEAEGLALPLSPLARERPRHGTPPYTSRVRIPRRPAADPGRGLSQDRRDKITDLCGVYYPDRIGI
jgi:hypothetical protein